MSEAFDPFRNDPFWRTKRLTPAQLLVHDVSFESLRPGKNPRLEVKEILSSTLLPDAQKWADPKANLRLDAAVPVSGLGSTRAENDRLVELQREYGWMNDLRKPDNPEKPVMCRWIHVYSKFPEYLQGMFLGLSDWSTNEKWRLDCLRQLDRSVYGNERFSKHGRYFSPFLQRLPSYQSPEDPPALLLMSVPFLDWTVNPGPKPPLRFQIDKREGYTSGQSSCHPLRSILQHYYRLEDTSDRERTQVFTRHKPWNTNRELDLKVRRWYGKYPSGLCVDELWILIIDESHIVTFSSNQTWKARWPPLQLAYRIAEVSFRGIRNDFFESELRKPYTAYIHAVACVHGAVGMMHRSFWRDLPLPLADRFAGYLGHLQYRLYRAPSAKLVSDLLQIQDELNITLQIFKKQEDILMELKRFLDSIQSGLARVMNNTISDGTSPVSDETSEETIDEVETRREEGRRRSVSPRKRIPDAPHQPLHTFRAMSPIDVILDYLRQEQDDTRELRDSSNELVTRTVQLVNMRLEDHGQAIIVFTIVTIIFLPISTVCSFFGMNVIDIRTMAGTQSIFWYSAASLTVVVVALSILVAFHYNVLFERFITWRQSQPLTRFRNRPTKNNQHRRTFDATTNFSPLDGTFEEEGQMM